MKLKTLKDFIQYCNELKGKNRHPIRIIKVEELKTEVIKIFKNLQGPKTIYPLILNDFPDDYKGSYAKSLWNNDKFRYGTEYGMLAMLLWFMNLKEDMNK